MKILIEIDEWTYSSIERLMCINDNINYEVASAILDGEIVKEEENE